jgi:hypothetical protein
MDYAITDAPNATDLPKCKEVAETLTTTYPGHNWWVTINDGMLIMKSLKVSSNAGMVVPLRRFDGDAARLKREVVMKAGEFLEAANLRRGAFQGENAKVLEGVQKNAKAKLMPQPKEYASEGIIVTDV